MKIMSGACKIVPIVVISLGLISVARAEPGKDRPKQDSQAMGLSDKDREKIEAVRKEMHEAVKPLRRQMRDAMTKLRDLIEDNAPDAELKTAMEKLEQIKKSMQAESEKFKEKMNSMLTPRQRAMMMMRGGKHEGKEHERGMMKRRVIEREVRREHNDDDDGERAGDDD